MASRQTNRVAKSQPNWGAFGLQFVGSIIYLAVVFSVAGWNMASVVAQAQTVGVAGLWIPLLYGAALIGAIALFFTSFMHLTRSTNVYVRGPMASSVVGGFALVALTYMLASGSGYLLLVIIGFALAYLGGKVAKYSM